MNDQKLILIRGIPGSGKSTLAELIAGKKETRWNRQWQHYEADQYFTDKDGIYRYDASKIKLAHEDCQKATNIALALGHSVVVSNTFVELWQLAPYYVIAAQYEIEPQIVECHSQFGNIHNVPETTLVKFATKWESFDILKTMQLAFDLTQDSK